MPGATEDALLDRLFSYYGPQEGDKKGRWCLEDSPSALEKPGGLSTYMSVWILTVRTLLHAPSGQSPLLRSSKPRHFLLGHSHGTNWVEYNVAGWLNYTKQNPATQNAPRLLQDSQK